MWQLYSGLVLVLSKYTKFRVDDIPCCTYSCDGRSRRDIAVATWIAELEVILILSGEIFASRAGVSSVSID